MLIMLLYDSKFTVPIVFNLWAAMMRTVGIPIADIHYTSQPLSI